MFFILKAQELVGGKNSIEKAIGLYIIFNIFYALFAIPFGMLADKIGRKKVIFSGYFLFSITCLGFVFFKSIFALIILFIFYGITYAFIEGNQRAYVAYLAADYIRATALGRLLAVRLTCGTGCRGRASPWRGKSSRCSPGCR